MKGIVISTSLNPKSNSRILAQEAHKIAVKQEPSVGFLDLQEVKLPICDGGAAYGDPAVKKVAVQIQEATAILVSTAIYNFDANAAAKNLVELTGSDCWENKLVGFLCAAGGSSSYMSIMGLANSLMLDFRCLILPRFVYATGDSFSGGKITDPKIQERVEILTGEWLRLGRAISD